MSIEGPKILGKIDLDKIPQDKKEIRPEKYKNQLDKEMVGISEKANEEFGEFLNSDATIKVENKHDLNWIKDKEEFWAREKGQDLKTYKEKKEKNPANITEMALTGLFNKYLSEDFLIVRASVFDDYKNGVDNVIVEKSTGNIICGFDDVISNEGNDGKEKKEDKILKKNKKGGAELKYGPNIKEEKLLLEEMKNIPAFYLSLSKKQLSNILKTEEKEKKEVFFEIITSWQEQIKKMEKEEIVSDPNFKENFSYAKNIIEKIINLTQ